MPAARSAAVSTAAQGSSVMRNVDAPAARRQSARSSAPNGPSVSAAGGVASGTKKPVTIPIQQSSTARLRAAPSRCPVHKDALSSGWDSNPRRAGSRRIQSSRSEMSIIMQAQAVCTTTPTMTHQTRNSQCWEPLSRQLPAFGNSNCLCFRTVASIGASCHDSPV